MDSIFDFKISVKKSEIALEKSSDKVLSFKNSFGYILNNDYLSLPNSTTKSLKYQKGFMHAVIKDVIENYKKNEKEIFNKLKELDENEYGAQPVLFYFDENKWGFTVEIKIYKNATSEEILNYINNVASGYVSNVKEI